MGSVGVPKATTQGVRPRPYQGGLEREWIEPRDSIKRLIMADGPQEKLP